MKKYMFYAILSGFILSVNFAFAQKPSDSPKAYFTLSETLIEYGNVVSGNTKTIEVKFTNTGKKPLIISDVYTTCGCTEIDYPREPFMPGKSGSLKISYNATEGEGVFNKTVTIYTNAKNNKETIKIQGIVVPK